MAGKIMSEIEFRQLSCSKNLSNQQLCQVFIWIQNININIF